MLSKIFHWHNILWIIILAWVGQMVIQIIQNFEILDAAAIVGFIFLMLGMYLMHTIKPFQDFLQDIFRPQENVDQFADPDYDPLKEK